MPIRSITNFLSSGLACRRITNRRSMNSLEKKKSKLSHALNRAQSETQAFYIKNIYNLISYVVTRYFFACLEACAEMSVLIIISYSFF